MDPSEVAIGCALLKNSIKNSPKFTGRHLFWSKLFNEVAGLSLQRY